MRQSAFCLPLYLTSVHFRGELQHLGHVDGQKIKCQPIRNREIGGVKLQDELYDSVKRQKASLGKTRHGISIFAYFQELVRVRDIRKKITISSFH